MKARTEITENTDLISIYYYNWLDERHLPKKEMLQSFFKVFLLSICGNYSVFTLMSESVIIMLLHSVVQFSFYTFFFRIQKLFCSVQCSPGNNFMCSPHVFFNSNLVVNLTSGCFCYFVQYCIVLCYKLLRKPPPVNQEMFNSRVSNSAENTDYFCYQLFIYPFFYTNEMTKK